MGVDVISGGDKWSSLLKVVVELSGLVSNGSLRNGFDFSQDVSNDLKFSVKAQLLTWRKFRSFLGENISISRNK